MIALNNVECKFKSRKNQCTHKMYCICQKLRMKECIKVFFSLSLTSSTGDLETECLSNQAGKGTYRWKKKLF